MFNPIKGSLNSPHDFIQEKEIFPHYSKVNVI